MAREVATSIMGRERLGYAKQWRRRESNPRYLHIELGGLRIDNSAGLLYAMEPQYKALRRIPAPLKIGYTRDADSLERRRRAIQTSLWLDIEIVWTAPGSRAMERELHRRLAAYRIRGEWFDNGPEVWALLESLAPRRAAA